VRRIILLDHHEWLEAGAKTRSFDVSAVPLRELVQVPGMEFDTSIHPVEVPAEGEATYVVAADFQDEAAIERLKNDARVRVRGVFADPEIGPFPVICPGGPVGAAADVRARLNLGPLQAAGFDGHGVRIAVVDTGIDGTRLNVVGGWSPRPGVGPGTTPAAHGTMVAYDAQLAAPAAMIYDYALLQSQSGGRWVAFLSDAIRAFAEIMAFILQNPGPMVVVNSWGMFDRVSDAPVGNPQNYSANPTHPFNQITGALAGSGADVFFAAGNCGSTCPDVRCGAGDRTPGNSIHGANSHPDVASVAAVTINDEVLGYSSEGPGGLTHDKPDFAAFSHFAGSGVNAQDDGTSAACPVAAGVAAALRSKPTVRAIPPADLRVAMVAGARGAGAWDPQTGWGIVDAGAALAHVP
jgi:hypothetical protein